MATSEQRVRQTTMSDGSTVDTTRRVDERVVDPVEEGEHKRNVAVRVVWFIAGVINALLAIRFVLALLGANPASGFVNFIYDITYPLVAPFFGVFGYNAVLGNARFEFYTLLAMLIYSLLAFGIARLLTITRRDDISHSPTV